MISLRSYKLRFSEEHVRAVPEVGLDGCPFSGPGVDLRGDDAKRAFAAARPIIAWLEIREPGVAVRSLSVNKKEQRILITLEDTPRPRVLRIDAPQASELVEAGADAEREIVIAAERALARRNR